MGLQRLAAAANVTGEFAAATGLRPATQLLRPLYAKRKLKPDSIGGRD